MTDWRDDYRKCDHCREEYRPKRRASVVAEMQPMVGSGLPMAQADDVRGA